MMFPTLGIRSVVIGDEDGVVIHAQIAFQSTEQMLGQMEGVPFVKGRTQALSELADERLCDQGQGHLPQTNVKIECACALPTQILFESEKLFDVPAFGKIRGQGRHFRAWAGAAKSLEMIGLGAFAGALDKAPARFVDGGAPGQERFAGGGKTGPVPGERVLRQGSVVALKVGGLAQRNQQIERGVLADMVQQFDRKMLDIGHEQRSLLRGGQDLLRQLEHLLGGGGKTARAAGVRQAKRLACFSVQKEKSLRLLRGCFAAGRPTLDHVAFGVADQAVRIQSQNPAGEVTTGPAQFAQRDLELLGLSDRVCFEQFVQHPIGRQEGQSVGQFKTFVPQRTILAQARPAKRGFVHQVQGQARSHGAVRRIARPGSQQIPGAQTQMLGHQQPQPQEIARNFIGQTLAHLTFQTGRVGLFEALTFAGPLNGNEWRRVLGVERVEFFFAGRNRR